MSGMMVEKTIMPAGPQVFVAADEFPNEIKRRLPGSTDVPAQHASSYRSERLGADGFCFDLIVHRLLRIGV
jgi:hypothetical protein